jgi:purine-nucleoside/S-methyl-5'-thioadenosine phosphorylase / adenosine deaminase
MAWSVERWSSIRGLEQAFGDRRALPAGAVTTLRQVHGLEVRAADEVVCGETQGDGLVAERPRSLVGVWTADCVPVHLVAPGERIAAALHCGWRGTAAGIVPAALSLLERRWSVPPTHIEAALGPAIGGCCYAVGEEVRRRFVERAGETLGGVGFRTRARQLHLDLRTFLAAELADLGVSRVHTLGPCTGCRVDVLYSFRVAAGAGRQLSWIGWRG